MTRYFASKYDGAPFILFGPAHLMALAVLLLLNLILLRFKNADAEGRRAVRWTLAIMLWGAETAWHVWNLATGAWSVQSMLPLNICSVLIWLSGFMLVLRQYRIYEFAYFLGIGGAVQYLATPDLGIYGFPHFRFFQTFISHGLLLTAPIYMTVVEGFRPTWNSVLRVGLWANVYAIVIYFVNLAIGSDYLMITAKPATASILDLLPPWPYYVAYMEIIGLLTVLLLYVPFFIQDRMRRSSSADAKM